MDWCVYVGSAATKNFEIGIDNRIWGHKTIFNGNQLEDIQPEDTLFFVYHLKKLFGANDPNQKGFPRVNIKSLYGIITSLVKCKVTSNYFYSNDIVWPNDIYPHRFNFEVIDRKENINFGLEFFTDFFVTAVRDSLLRKGSAIPFTTLSSNQIYSEHDLMDREVNEGAPIYHTHKKRERNSKVVDDKKAFVLATTGQLKCEACGFDFLHHYGERGKGFIECHHLNPLADSETEQQTRQENLALLCSNCHRMIHRQKPWLEIDELKAIIQT